MSDEEEGSFCSREADVAAAEIFDKGEGFIHRAYCGHYYAFVLQTLGAVDRSHSYQHAGAYRGQFAFNHFHLALVWCNHGDVAGAKSYVQ
jgi:hypothetical protein